MLTIAQSQEWKALEKHKLDVAKLQLKELFNFDPDRFNRFSVRFEDCLLDFSKNRMTQETIQLLLNLTGEAQLGLHIDDMFSGKKINATENRAVLHTALRNRSNTPILVDGKDVMPGVNAVLGQMQVIVDQIRSHRWRGFSDKPIQHIVNIGIGGSDLGPKMAVHALKNFSDPNLSAHFVSNVDGTALTRALQCCDPETTLFIVASKTFTTQETLANANAAKEWFLTKGEVKDLGKHFIALTTQTEKASAWGIPKENMLGFWDWVGGRYSMWSAIGLSIAIMIGMDHFKELLAGAHAMDQHFRTTAFDQNLPVLLALTGVWNHSFFHMPSNAILPYCDALEYFPLHLQQVEMESNGKKTDMNGREIIDYQTSPVVWGTVGTNGQHSFHQLLHQGTAKIWCDFILPIESPDPVNDQHDLLAANCFAQSQALMMGKTLKQAENELIEAGMSHEKASLLAPHKVIAGNKSSNTLLLQSLTPYTLGLLTALYEHKIFVQGVVWQINSFDQWGVELGKQLANKIIPNIKSKKSDESLDGSTKGLINTFTA